MAKTSLLTRASNWIKDGRPTRGDALSAPMPTPWRAVSEPAGTGRITVGPGGVYLLRRGGLEVSPSSPRLADAARAAALLSNRLTAAAGEPVIVHPVLVVEADVQTADQPAGVTVVAGGVLHRWLRTQPTVVPVDRQARLSRAARNL